MPKRPPQTAGGPRRATPSAKSAVTGPAGTGPGRTARAEHVARRRGELLHAALTTIRRVGSSTSMDDVAREAGITRPILYRYFGDRGGLVEAVADQFAGQFLEDIGRIAEEKGAVIGEHPIVTAGAVLDAFFAVVDREPALYRFLLHHGLYGDAGARGSLKGFIENVEKRLAMIIGELLRNAGLDSGPAEPWAAGLVGMAVFSAEWWLERQVLTRDRMVSYLTDLVGGGLAMAAPAAGSIAFQPIPAVGSTADNAHPTAGSTAADIVDTAAGAVSSIIRSLPKGRRNP